MGKSGRLALSLAFAGALFACKKEEPASYPQVVYQTGVPAATTAPGAPAPASAPVPGAAAVGLPCASERDLQCAFSHCIGGRCGGCRSSAECKPGSQCLPSWLGYACFPGVAPTTSQTPSPAPVPVPITPAGAASALDPMRALCVQRTNESRARVSVPALARRVEREACADSAAQSDGAQGTAHGAFGRCQEAAQNECPGWPGPIDQVIDKCLAQMFAEGPGPFAGHGHYLNMTAAGYTGVACGFATAADGKLWIVQNFYR